MKILRSTYNLITNYEKKTFFFHQFLGKKVFSSSTSSCGAVYIEGVANGKIRDSPRRRDPCLKIRDRDSVGGKLSPRLHFAKIRTYVCSAQFTCVLVVELFERFVRSRSYSFTERHFKILDTAYCFSPTTLCSANLEKFWRSIHYEPLCFLYIFCQSLYISLLDVVIFSLALIYIYIYMLFAGWEVRIVKNCENAAGLGQQFQDRGHSFSLYGPT